MAKPRSTRKAPMLAAPKRVKRKPSAVSKAKPVTAAPVQSAVPSFDAAAPSWPSGGLQKLNLD